MNSLVTGYRQYLQANNKSDDRSDIELTLSLGDDARSKGVLGDQPEDFLQQYYQMKEAMEPGFVATLKKAGVRGWERGMQGLSALVAPTELAESIATRQQAIDQNPTSESSQRFNEAKGLLPSIAAFVKHPLDITGEVIVESLGQSWPALVSTFGGATVGGAATAETGPGALVGSAVGAFAGSGLVEFSSKVLDSMVEAGMDIRDPESIKRFFSDPALVERSRAAAVKRAIPVAAFDAITAGMAGKFLGPLKRAAESGLAVPLRSTLAATAKEVGMQAAGGMAGEAAGQVAAGEPIDPKAIAMEGIAEIGSAPSEIAGNIREFRGEPKAAAPASVKPVTPAARPAAPVASDTGTRGDIMRAVLGMSEDEQKIRYDALEKRKRQSQGLLPANEEEELRIITNLNAGKPGFAPASAPGVPAAAPVAAPTPSPTSETPSPSTPESAEVPLVTPDPVVVPQPLSPEAIIQKVENLGNRLVRLDRRGGDTRAARQKLDAMVEADTITREGLADLESEVTKQEAAAVKVVAKVKSGQASLLSDKEKLEAANIRAELAKSRTAKTLDRLRTNLTKLAQGTESGAGSAPNLESGVEATPAPAPLAAGRLIEPHQEYTLDAEQSKAADWQGVFKKALGLDKKSEKGAGLRKHASNARQSTVGIALLDTKTGQVHLRGLLGDAMPFMSEGGEAQSGLGVQGMGKISGTRTNKTKHVSSDGKAPALLGEVVQAGFVPIGRVNFENAGKISQDFPNRQAFLDSAKLTEIAATQAEGRDSKVKTEAVADVARVNAADNPSVAADTVNRQQIKKANARKTTDREGPVVFNSEAATAADIVNTGQTPMERGSETRVTAQPTEETEVNRYGPGPWAIQKRSKSGWTTEQEIKLSKGKKGAVSADTISAAFAKHIKGQSGSFRVVNADGEAHDRVTQRRVPTKKVEAVSQPTSMKDMQAAYKLLSEVAKSEEGNRESYDWVKALAARLVGLDDNQAASLLKDFLLGKGAYNNRVEGQNFSEIIGGYKKAYRVLHDTLQNYDQLSTGNVSAQGHRGTDTAGGSVAAPVAGTSKGSGRRNASAGKASDGARAEGGHAVGRGERGGAGQDGQPELNLERVREFSDASLAGIFKSIERFGKGIFDAQLVSRYPESVRDSIYDLIGALGMEWDDFQHHIQNNFDASNSAEEFVAGLRGEEAPVTPEVTAPAPAEAPPEVKKSAGFGETSTPHDRISGVTMENTFNPVTGRIENPDVLPDSAGAANYNLDEAARRGRQVKAIDPSAPAAFAWVSDDTISPKARAQVSAVEASLNAEQRDRQSAAVRIRPVTAREEQGQGARSADSGYGLVSAARAVGRVFGKEVVFVEIAGGEPGITFLGLTDAKDVILINKDSPFSVLQLVGHELTHGLDAQRPDLFDKLASFVEEWAPMPSEYVKRKQATGAYAPDEIRVEWVSDMVGERFAEPDFWAQFQKYVGQDKAATPEQRSAMMSMATWMGAWVKRIMGSFRKFLAGTSVHVRDLARAQDVIADVMAQYAASAPYAEQMKAEVKSINKSTTKEIEYVEAEARVTAASWNELMEVIGKQQAMLMPKATYEDFWRMIARGDTPSSILDAVEKRARGTMQSRISDEVNTPAMRSQMYAYAYKLARSLERNARQRAARALESMTTASEKLEDYVQRFTKAEKEYMDASASQASLLTSLKDILDGVAKDIGRIANASFEHGELTGAIREMEGLSKDELIPEDYQKVFRQIIASDGTSVFERLSALAQLNLPLRDMTAPAIVDAMAKSGQPKLIELAKQRPLAVALAVLARNSTKEMDLMQLRLLKDSARSVAIKQNLDSLRSASDERLDAMWPALQGMLKSNDLAARLQAAYVQDRRNLRRAQTNLKKAAERERINRAFADAIGAKREELGKTSGDFAKWVPADGATYTAMRLNGQGAWINVARTLRMAGAEVTAQHEQLSQDLAANRLWLQAHPDQDGTPLYNLVKLQTSELSNIDLSRKYGAANRWFMDKLLTPLGQKFAQMGGVPGQAVNQMLQRYQFITKGSQWHDGVVAKSKQWDRALQAVTKAAGYAAPQEFFRDIHDQVIYSVESNPGKDGASAIRDAVRAARRRLPIGNTVSADFASKMSDYLHRTKEMSEYMLSVAEANGVYIEDRQVKNLMRHAIQYGWLTSSRKLRTETISELATVLKDAGWTGDTFSSDEAMADPSKFFTPDVVRLGVVPYIMKPGKEVFFGADRTSGRWSFVSQVQAQAVWDRSEGDVMRFINNLFDETYEPVQNSDPAIDRGEFTTAMLKKFDSLMGMISSVEKSVNKPGILDKAGPLPHRLMDGRTNDVIPPEFFEYDSFDTRSAEIQLAEIAYHAAFGRNGTKFEESIKALHEDLKMRKQRYDQLRGVTEAQKKAEATAKGWSWHELKSASRDYDRVGSLVSAFGVHFGGNSIEMGSERALLEFLQTQASLVLNQPTSALWNVPSILDFPVVIGGSMGVKATGRTLRHLLDTVFGSALGAANINILRASTYQAEIANARHGEQQKLTFGEHMADIGRNASYYEGGIGNRATQGSKFIQSLMKKGASNKGGYMPFNGIWAPFNFLGEAVATSVATANVENFELMVKRTMDFFRNNPDALNDPAYRVTAKDLGMSGSAFFSDERAFDYYRTKAFEYGMGGIEDIARGALEKGGRLLTEEQVLAVAQMAFNEVSLESSINSRPIEFTNNPILRYGGLLLGWPLAKMNQVHASLKTVDGRRDLSSVARGIGVMAAWSLPMGLAFSFLMDDWDEDVVGKRSNRREIDKVAGLPVVGPLLALTIGERGAKSNALGMLERAAKAGNVYGLGADMVNSMVNVVDPTAGQRDFSLDSRILAFSQWANLRDMVRNFIHQDFTYTYESVGRPLLLAVGGNGLIQAQQILNNQLDLDNAERWIAERISVGNYLRAAGREIGMELKAGAGRSSPTPISVWEREMWLAAVGNDRMKFLEAWRAAVAAARKQGAEDPENTVLQAWRGRNPVGSVFRTKPTDEDMARLMRAMDDKGRQAVRDAVRLYDDFTDMIEPSPMEKVAKRAMTPPKPQRPAASLFR